MYEEYDSVRFFLRLPPLAPLGFLTDFFAGCFFAGGMTVCLVWVGRFASDFGGPTLRRRSGPRPLARLWGTQGGPSGKLGGGVGSG